MLKNASKTEKVVESIRNRIISGELIPGDKLPPLRELVSIYNASRSVINQAIGTLSAKGYLEVKPRQYIMVNDIWASGNLEIVNDVYFAPKSRYKSRAIREMLKARKMAEIASLGEITPDNIPNLSQLKIIYAEEKKWLGQKSADIGIIADLDSKFHEEVVSLSNNYVLSLLYLAFKNIGDDLIRKFYFCVNETDCPINWHGQFIEALENKDIGNAKIIWLKLLSKGEEVILQNID